MHAPQRPIRPARPEHLEAIRALLRECELPVEDLSPDDHSHFLVVHEGTRLRGCVGLEPAGDAALLRSLAVRPSDRGRGLGARLVAAAERRARAAEHRTLYLFTTTAADYFRDRGYERVERAALPAAIRQTEEAARLCPSTAPCLRKHLGPSEPPA